jgi:hypothetical protein
MIITEYIFLTISLSPTSYRLKKEGIYFSLQHFVLEESTEKAGSYKQTPKPKQEEEQKLRKDPTK